MPLFWSDQDAIAKALLTAYPDTDRLALDDEDLRNMITTLPGFESGQPAPVKACLDKILWTWMRFADGGEGVAVSRGGE